MAARRSCPVVLLAEDEAIIAIELEDGLVDAGFTVAGPFATCSQAEAWLQEGNPDAAILDHKLKDGACDSLIADLSRRGVPIIVFTGHDAPQIPAPARSTATWVTKPIAFPALLTELRRQMQASSGDA
jgi:DNA-binding response OmpR family regulator